MGTEIERLPAAHLLKMVAGDATDVTFTREEATAELLRRLYSQDMPCTTWGKNVESRLDSLWRIHEKVSLEKLADRVEELEERVGDTTLDAPLSDTSIAHAKRLNAIRKWCDRMDEGLDELHGGVAEAKAGDAPMPLEQVIDQVRYHAERVAELLEQAMECREESREEWPGSYAEELRGQAEDYLAAAKVHNQTARALATVVDHRRAER